MSSSNNILLLVKKHHEKLVTKYTSRIKQLETDNELLKQNNMDVNNKLALVTIENEILRKEFDTTIDLLTKYFESLDNKPAIVSPAISIETIKTVQFIEPTNKEPSIAKSDKLTFSTVLDNDPKPLFSPPYKYLPRRHKSFTQAKRVPLLKKLQKYKPTDYYDSSDTDEEPKIMSSPEPVSADSTPISVLKKILTDDFSAPKNNKDAPYSFNNMKPYIFTLDKNNKK